MAESPELSPRSTRRLAKRLQVRVLQFFLRLNLTERHFLLALAMVVGIEGGFGSVLFQSLLDAIKSLVLIQTGKGPPYLLPLIPALGGLAAGLLVYYLAREARGAGVSEVMNAIVTREGIIQGRVGVVKMLASALTLGSGGSAGSEGPVVQIGAAWGSGVGQIFRFSENNLKVLIACGSAAGISAIFNAPIAGVLFALEVILGDFTIAAFTPVVVSSVLSAVVAQAYRGDRPVFEMPDYHFVSAFELGWFMLLAVLAGFLGVLFIRALYGAEDLFEKVRFLLIRSS